MTARTCCLLLLCISLYSCKKNGEEITNGDKLRVSGYVYENFTASPKPDLSKLTDLNIAFINPDSSGSLYIPPQTTTLISDAHAKGLRVYMSIGGGAAPYSWLHLLETKRDILIADLVNGMTTHKFDGIDVDLEGDFINEHYPDFISELAQATKAKNKLLTAALATWNADIIHDSTLSRFDYINIMSYDATGPWNPGQPGQHSPISMTENDINYFVNKRSIDPSKLLAGLPFYGYFFTSGTVIPMTFADIVSQYPEAGDKDEVNLPSGTIYYNGIPTIKQKVNLAMRRKLAGVMIWELNQDGAGNNSLLKAISEEN